MADKTKIEWTDATWNVVNGCSLASPGCTNCYAMKQAHRVECRRGLTHKTNGGMVWTGEVRFNDKVLLDPLRWRRPRRIFVCAHGDLFHEKVPDEWIDRVFAVMALCPQHSFQVLTKRADRMRAYVTEQTQGRRYLTDAIARILAPIGEHGYDTTRLHGAEEERLRDANRRCSGSPGHPRPLRNVWLGVSVEDQQRADERIPDLLSTPAAVRWLSCEPLLGQIRLPRVDFHCDLCGGTGILARWPKGKCHHCDGRGEIPAISTDPKFGTPSTPMRSIDWVVVGGESGPNARPIQPDWARSLRDQCEAAGVPFLFKQWGHFAPTSDCNGPYMMPVGKKKAGRLLDGVQYDGFPA